MMAPATARLDAVRAAVQAIDVDALGAEGSGVGWVATRFGEWVGWGSTPERAYRCAELMGMTRCEVAPDVFDLHQNILRSLAHRRWRSERELLELLLESTLGGCDDLDDGGGLRRIDAIEDALDDLDHPPLPLPVLLR